MKDLRICPYPQVSPNEIESLGIRARRPIDTSAGGYEAAQAFLIDQFGDAIDPITEPMQMKTSLLWRVETASRYKAARELRQHPGVESILDGIYQGLDPQQFEPMTSKVSPQLKVATYGGYKSVGLVASRGSSLALERTLLTHQFDKQVGRCWWSKKRPFIPLARLVDTSFESQLRETTLPTEAVMSLGRLSITRRRKSKQSNALRSFDGSKVEDYDELVAISHGQL